MPTVMAAATEERRNRALAETGAQLRADGDGGGGGDRFVGLASPTGVRAPIGNPKTWGFFEEFAPGAFTKTLQEGDQRMLIDHDSYYVVSRVSAGTLQLSTSKRGLEVDSALDVDLSYVADLKANLRNGNITGMSIGFFVEKEKWSDIEVEEEGEDGKIRVYQAELRTVLEVRLIEVSAVTFPAFVDTEAELNSVMVALTRRGDRSAIESRAEHRPELRTLLAEPDEPTEQHADVTPDNGGVQVIESEPGETTRDDDNTAEPGETTPRHVDRIDLAMRGYAARYRLRVPD